MPYDVVLDGKSVERDLEAMPDVSRRQVLRAIYERLTVAPISLGKPLTGEFKGFYRLRVGDWRVIYKVEAASVIIRTIKLRRDSYKGR